MFWGCYFEVNFLGKKSLVEWHVIKTLKVALGSRLFFVITFSFRAPKILRFLK